MTGTTQSTKRRTNGGAGDVISYNFLYLTILYYRESLNVQTEILIESSFSFLLTRFERLTLYVLTLLL